MRVCRVDEVIRVRVRACREDEVSSTSIDGPVNHYLQLLFTIMSIIIYNYYQVPHNEFQIKKITHMSFKMSFKMIFNN